MRKPFSLILFLFIWFLIALGGSWATSQSVKTWYQTLDKPFWTPPSWVFGPVWTILYILIAIAGWLIFIGPKTKARTQSLRFYWVQAFLNFLWSFLFFYYRSPLLGLVDISALIVLIALLLRSVWKCNQRASFLLLPYFIWVIYAWTLNLYIYVEQAGK